jgi:uncharacterized protein
MPKQDQKEINKSVVIVLCVVGALVTVGVGAAAYYYYGIISGPVELCKAAGKGDLAKVRTLIERGVDVNSRPVLGKDNGVEISGTPLLAATAEDKIEVVKYLLDKGANVNIPNGNGDTALIFAAQRGNLPLAGLLINAGAEINVEERHGITPLMWAALGGHLEVMRKLFENGANINARDGLGNNPLMFAALARKNAAEAVKLLAGVGAHPEVKDRKGRTPLRRAQQKGKSDVVQVLRTFGATE